MLDVRRIEERRSIFKIGEDVAQGNLLGEAFDGSTFGGIDDLLWCVSELSFEEFALG